jgi:prepilin-type N-terminal cleavage/methylation domain-containing protein
MPWVTRPQEPRAGFTLIELLVVIAIIGVLVGLAAAAIFPLLGKGPEMTAHTELRQLTVSMESFKTKHGVYPPSSIFLANSLAAYSGAPAGSIQQQSLGYLLHIWPRLFDRGTTVNWGSASGLLQGDQCLVFFLGGMQTPQGPVGFSTNARDPTAMPAVANELRDGPYYNFDTTRLISPSARKAPPFNNTALVYIDPWGKMPYAYFSSGKKANGYNFTPLITGMPVGGDCPDLMVSPYFKALAPTGGPTQFYNPDTFQIISAGKDGIFGLGNLHVPGAPVENSPKSPAIDQGADDFSNFAGGRLGAGL